MRSRFRVFVLGSCLVSLVGALVASPKLFALNFDSSLANLTGFFIS